MFNVRCRYALLAFLVLAPLASAQEKKEERPSQKAVVGADTTEKLGVAFGKEDLQKLDVYSPKKAKGAPVVVFVHGGEWMKGDKADVSYKPKFFNENGIVFVSINYRLAPKDSHPAQVSDVAAANRWVRDHADEIGASPSKIFLMGHSAGCHLVALVGVDPRYLEKAGLKSSDLRGVIAWSGGAYDLVDLAKGEGNYPKYIRQTFGDSEAAWKDASPAAHVGDAPMPPFLFAYVERKQEGTAPRVERSVAMADLIRKAKGTAEVHLIEGKTHFDANHLLGAPGDTMGELVLRFLRKNAD